MGDSSITKVQAAGSPRGELGQHYLASGVGLAMRMFREEPVGEKDESARDYETVGYVISGSAELELEGQSIQLAPGDSWVVPRGATHRYRIREPFTAVEATHPPAQVHARDER
jgi:quercetin dioxygenase-like cupin family protein